MARRFTFYRPDLKLSACPGVEVMGFWFFMSFNFVKITVIKADGAVSTFTESTVHPIADTIRKVMVSKGWIGGRIDSVVVTRCDDKGCLLASSAHDPGEYQDILAAKNLTEEQKRRLSIAREICNHIPKGEDVTSLKITYGDGGGAQIHIVKPAFVSIDDA